MSAEPEWCGCGDELPQGSTVCANCRAIKEMFSPGHCDHCGADDVLVNEADWYDGPLYACDPCFAMLEVLSKLAEVYTPEGCAIWIDQPNLMLNGRIPGELIVEGESGRVLALIEALAEGVVM